MMQAVELSTIVIILSAISLVIFIVLKVLKKPKQNSLKVQVPLEIQKIDYGEIQILFGSQTGTAAKLAETFGNQAQKQGFTPVIIDLKDLSTKHFHKGQISVFLLSNTGEGDPPDNCVVFMRMLRAKSLDKVHLTQQLSLFTSQLWKNLTFTIFGLGNTQYEHYNKTAIDADACLQQKGAFRLYPLGLGDNNSSLEDDYNLWKTPKFWETLRNYRKEHPIKMEKKLSVEIHHHHTIKNYLTPINPAFALWKFIYLSQPNKKGQQMQLEQLDFRTKAYLKAEQCQVIKIQQKRQNTSDGSSLQLIIRLNREVQYQTAGNLALWPENDPIIVEKVSHFFGVKLDSLVSIEPIVQKKLKLNFQTPLTIEKLLTKHIDLQHKITKSILKKLGILQSNNKQYFILNSSPKTTQEYKNITQKKMTSIFQLIQQYQVKITFEDFIELSDSISPRLFTIASSSKKHKDIHIVASIIQNGLISKSFLRNPSKIYGELRKSTFTDAMQWDKVIFVSAGTGFAPFRGYLQEKEVLIKNGSKVPLVSLFYGCRHQNGDFIYKQEIKQWVKNKTINILHTAFSRDEGSKVYVQHLLRKSKQELKQLILDQKTAMYICGSLAMGSDVNKCLSQFMVEEMGISEQEGKQKIKQLEQKGKLVKQLW